MTGFARTFSILAAITLGALIPHAHVLSGAIRWMVVAMLFIVFLQTRLSFSTLTRQHVILFTANIVLGFGAWALGWAVGGREVALAAYFCGIAPTAIAAPVIISFLGGRVDFVVASFLFTNLGVAALLPLMLPVVLGRATPEAFAQVLGSVGFVVFLPMGLAWLVRALHAKAAEWPGKLRNVSFYLWVTTMFLITSNASHFLRVNSDTPRLVLLEIVAVTASVCVINFAVGRWIGSRAYPREASQALGQKNTTFTIYLALAYAGPVAALGPTCYVIWHNLWNSWQLHRASRRRDFK